MTARPQGLSLLTQGWNILRRRKWLIAAAIGIALIVGIVVTLLATPQYTATSVIEIQRETRNFTMVKGADSNDNASMDTEFYQTQYGLLESKSLAERVVNQLRLADDATFFETFGSGQSKEWFANGRPVAAASTRDQRIRAASAILLDRIQITPERLSRLVRISFSAPDAAFSKKVVDAWGAQFIQQTLARRFDTTAYARRFLEQRLAQLRVRIDESERKLVDYAARESIVNLPGETSANGTTTERPLVVDDLSTLNRELAQATADRIRAGSRLNSSTGGQSAEALQNTTITQLRTQRASLSSEYAKLMVQFEPQYPPAVALRRQIALIDQTIAREEGRVGGSLRSVYDAATTRENELRSRVKELEQSVLNFRRRSIQYNIFQRDADTNRQLYDALLQRYKEIGVAGGVGVNNISVVDEAELPIRPSSPRPLLNLATALLVGLALGAIVAVIIEQVDDRLRNPADITALLDIPLFGTIPKLRDGNAHEALRDPKSVLSEAYLSLQTSLAFSTSHGVPKTLSVTSSRPAEGKSTTSDALARALARSGRRVLLIDGDMRSPSVHHLFDAENRVGLSNYLSGDDRIETLWRPTDVAGLWIMTAGPKPPSAAELLTGNRLGELLSKLGTSFDHIVVDAPPVMGLADAPLIGSATEGTVFVVDMQATRRTIARVALDRLLTSQTHVLGAVLTKYDQRGTAASYGYDYSYNYGEQTA
ncbi:MULTISPECIES: GumC family protein [unclassified Sphingomonas]|uniref:GumC family protein n=1 Tax=unclassified Sphingomonas TaxID=196159 RepID=UPI001F1E66C1|nr:MULTISPECIES: polysaccharide biosynthesis tyrosine autokinase [unclassified Sphingomonas]